MKNCRLIGILTWILLLLSSSFSHVCGQGNRIEYNGKDVFLSGANISWVNYASDIGDPDTPPDTAFFRQMFRDMHDHGANSMRFWIHINGKTTPQFTGNLVTGPGERAIKDLKTICDLAFSNDIGLILCLWSFDMQRIKDTGLPQEHLDRNEYILTTEEGLDSYIDNALIPMVDSLEDHPGIIAWEIFNEPEGMTEVGAWDITQHVTQLDVQKFINKCAGAIHRTDPGAKVSNGAWSFIAASDVEGGTNYYTDERLIAAGGDSDGFLDFYMVHYYDWDDTSPFLKPYSYWELDKPLVVAEFYPDCQNCGEGSSYENLYLNAYAGSLGWQYIDDSRDEILKQTQLLFDQYPEDIVPDDPHLGYPPSVYIKSPLNLTEYLLGEDVLIEVHSQKYNGLVRKVEFYEGDQLLGEDEAEPYSFLWENPGEGRYALSARSIDDEGLEGTSSVTRITVGDPPDYIYEAEEAVLLGGSNLRTDSEASGGVYVFMEENNGGSSIEWLIPNCPLDSIYSLKIGYRTPFGYKEQDLYVNDQLFLANLGFEGSDVISWFEDSVIVALNAGENKIKIVSGWGFMDFDYLRTPFSKQPFIAIESFEIVSESGLDYIDEKDGFLRLSVEIQPDNATDKTVSWSSSDNALAMVNQNGFVRARGDGVVTITAVSVADPSVTDHLELTISGQSVGINPGNFDSDFSYYPNPVIDKLHLEGLGKNIEIALYTLSGKKVRHKRSQSPTMSLDVSDLPKGIYLLQLAELNGMTRVLKIAKM
jgi:hypothetical protein